MENCVFANNSTSNGSLSIPRNGGAIGYNGGGQLTIIGSTFSNNVAGGNANAGAAGGAVSFNNSTNAGGLTITNSTFTNNAITGTAAGSLGGAVSVSGVGSFTISGSTFTNNSAGSNRSRGGAIDFTTSPGNSLMVTNSTFVGNTAAQGGGINAQSGTFAVTGSRFFNNTATTGEALANGGATATANDNWWGADSFPTAISNPAGADSVVTLSGSTALSTRLALALAASPATIGTGGTSTLSAAIVSTSAPTTPKAGTALDGLALSFAPGNLGSVSPASAEISSGTASATFRAGSTAGTTSPSIRLDNGTKLTSVTIVAAPTANSQSVATAFNTARAITLTGTDPNSPPRSLTYTIATGPANGTLSGTAPNLTYTPRAGFQGTDSFTFTTNNGVATSNTATVAITVSPGTPTANSQTVAVAHNSAGTPITLTGSDPDNPPLPLTYTVVAGPSRGTLTGSGANRTYVPNPGTYGADTFTFRVSNGTNTSSTATVTLNVAVGTPTANAQSASTSRDTPVAVTLTGSDDNRPALPLAYAVTTAPRFGTLSGTAPNLTYTPNVGYTGADSFAFTVSNGTNTSVPATVSLTVNQVASTVGGTLGVGWGASGSATVATAGDGLRLLPQGRSNTIPWAGLNRLTITLDRAAALSASDVSVTGVNVASYGPVTVSGSGTTYTITPSRPIDEADRVTLTIANSSIAAFTRRLDVLPGDYNDDGAVTMQDAIGIRNSYLGINGAVPTLFGDINGDGVVDANDYNAARRRIGTVLP